MKNLGLRKKGRKIRTVGKVNNNGKERCIG
jgi:hypothetical protein